MDAHKTRNMILCGPKTETNASCFVPYTNGLFFCNTSRKQLLGEFIQNQSLHQPLQWSGTKLYAEHQLHAAVVEIYAAKGAEVKYATVQNWYPGDKEGIGGVYNFVTKRGICAGAHAKISWTQVETGSAFLNLLELVFNNAVKNYAMPCMHFCSQTTHAPTY